MFITLEEHENAAEYDRRSKEMKEEIRRVSRKNPFSPQMHYFSYSGASLKECGSTLTWEAIRDPIDSTIPTSFLSMLTSSMKVDYISEGFTIYHHCQTSTWLEWSIIWTETVWSVNRAVFPHRQWPRESNGTIPMHGRPLCGLLFKWVAWSGCDWHSRIARCNLIGRVCERMEPWSWAEISLQNGWHEFWMSGGEAEGKCSRRFGILKKNW